MKRRELMKRLARMAKHEESVLEITEGASHTKVRIGDRVSVVPRHSEINEITARSIIRKMEG